MDTIELLRRQIEEMKIPPLPSQQEQDQIMKGRKSQAEIDQGRAAVQARIDAHNQANTRRGELIKQLTDLQGKAKTANADVERRAYDESWQGKLVNALKGYGPFAAGGGAGYAYGAGTNAMLDRYERSNARNLSGIAGTLDDVDLTTPTGRAVGQGAVEASRSFMPSPGARGIASRAAGLVGRGAAYGLPAGAMLYEAMNYRQQAEDESLPEADRENARLIGNALIGAGSGVAIEGGRRAIFPRRPETLGRSIAKIRAAEAFLRDNPAGGTATPLTPARPTIDITPERASPALADAGAKPALPAPDAPPKPAAAPGTKAYLQEQARALGIKGLSKMSKAELAKALAGSVAEHGGKRTVAKRLPKPPSGTAGAGLAAALGYAMTPERAEAATGERSANRAEAMTNAAIAGGGAYGVSRLAQALMPALRGGLTMAGEAMAPLTIDAMTDYSPEELAQGRNWMARNLPSALRFGAVEDAYQMATVPERNPERGEEAYYDDATPPVPSYDEMTAARPADTLDAGVDEAALGRISEAQMRQLAAALASQGVAGRGAAFPQQIEYDERTRRLAEALMPAN